VPLAPAGHRLAISTYCSGVQPNQPYDSGWPPQQQYPGPPQFSYPDPQLAPPFAPTPPRRSGGGRTALVVILILVALVCLGVPAAGAVVYATTEDGPYTSVDTVCALFSGENGKKFTGGQAGRPGAGTGAQSCVWDQAGLYVFEVYVEVVRKDRFTSSVDGAAEEFGLSKNLYFREISKPRTMSALEDAWGIGDQAYLQFTSQVLASGKDRADKQILLARKENAIIHVEFTAFSQASEFLGPAECTKLNRDFREPGIELYNLVVPGLRQSG
jgi:hypothetical protein